MIWNIQHNKNLFLKLKPKLVLCHNVPTTPKIPEKLILTVAEMHQLVDIEKIASKKEKTVAKKGPSRMVDEKYV